MSRSFTCVPSPAGSTAKKIVMGSRARAPTGPRLPLAFVAGCIVATLALVESADAKRIVGTKGPDRIVGSAKADYVKPVVATTESTAGVARIGCGEVAVRIA